MSSTCVRSRFGSSARHRREAHRLVGGTMSSSVDRRSFVKTAAATGVGLMTASTRSSPLFVTGSPGETIVVTVMGLNGRGMVHARALARTPNVSVGYLCDVDSDVLGKAANTVAEL